MKQRLSIPRQPQISEKSNGNNEINKISRTRHPTIANYRRVLSVLRKTSGLLERADKRKEMAFMPDQRPSDFPHAVIAVTEELHKLGLRMSTVSASRIREEAVRIIVTGTLPEPVIWKPNSIVISFRIPQESADTLDKLLEVRQIVGVKSRCQLVRRLALDFTTERLVYSDSSYPQVDWHKLSGPSSGKASSGGKPSVPLHQVPHADCPQAKPLLHPLTEADLSGDIARMILKVVTPYVDSSNPMLHSDELQADCRAKLAKIIHDRVLARCRTRGKAFAFLKTSFRNLVMGLVQKHAFTAKRTGVVPPPRRLRGNASDTTARKLQSISLDDPDIGLQVGFDDHRLRQGELIDDLVPHLSVSECAVLEALVRKEPESASGNGKADTSSECKSRKERQAQAKLRRKCREILLGNELG